MSMESKPININIQAEPEELKGRYANLCAITSQERDVVIDFIAVANPAQTGGRLVSRIFMNRFTAQELIEALKANLEKWEKLRYEPAAPPTPPADQK